jgi:RNA polymerase sigma-70 factor (ECF subfamily)
MAEISGTLFRFPAITPQMPLLADDGTVEPSDRDLMHRTAAGDRDAFADVYRRHHAGVYRFARLMTGSGALAEDVVQEVFLVLMRNAARYDASRSTLSTYLFGIARHYTRRRLSRERRFVELDEQQAERCLTAVDGPHTGLEQQHDLQRLRCAVLALPSRYREVIVLCDLQDVSYAEAAATIGCAVGTVRSRLHRARQILGDRVRRRAGIDTCRVTRATERYAV